MLQIRSMVFETNSSSNHSICITKKHVNIKLPDKIIFKHGTFLREAAILNKTEEKASYLYQAICGLKEPKDKHKIINNIYAELTKYGIDAEFEEGTREYKSCIDHPHELMDWLNDILKNSKRLIRFLCSEESFIITSDDGADEVNICVS